MNRSQRSAAVLTTIALLALAPAVARADDPNSYIAVKGGPYVPTATNLITALGDVSVSWPTSYTIEGAVGTYWGIFGLQLSAGYLTTGGATQSTSAGTAQITVNAIPILAIAKVRLPLGFIAPFVEGGAGVAIATGNFNATQNLSSTQASFEAVGGGGVELYLGPILVGAEARFMWLNPSFNFSGSTYTVAQSFNLSGVTVEGYIGYRF